MNKVILMGRLTRNPEIQQTGSGVSVCRFSIAVNRNFKNQQGQYDADFISCVAWKQTADFIGKYFTKGQMITVEGSLRTGSYQDKNHSDVTHYTTDVYIDNVEFCGNKQENNSNPTQQLTAQNIAQKAQGSGIEASEYDVIIEDEEMPF